MSGPTTPPASRAAADDQQTVAPAAAAGVTGSQPEVDALAGGGSLSVDGFVYVDGNMTDAKPPAVDKEGGDGSEGADADRDEERSNVAAAAMDVRHKQLMYAIHSLKMYNPDFNLTPEVLEIMRVFFDDMHPDDDGTISLRALFDEIERLDPEKQLLSEETRQLMWRDISGNSRDASERIDFHGFCAWVMRWKEISPVSIRNMYTSWAQQIAMVDFGLHEADGVFVVRSEELPPSDVLKTEISKLLKARQRLNPRLSRENSNKLRVAGDSASPGVDSQSVDGMDSVDAITGAQLANDGIVGDEEDEEDLGGAQPAELTTSVEPDGSMKTMSKSFIAGGAAGIAAKSLLAPVDRVKIMFQVNDKRHFSFRNAYHLAREIYVQDGFRALFRGNMLNILRVVPYAGVQHSSFDFFRRKFHAYNFAQAEKKGANDQFQKLSNLQLVTAGSLAGGLSLVMAYPLDIVRARYMVQQGKHQYQTLYEAVASMYKLEGARSFSRGLVPSLLGTLPYTGIGFALNEKFKGWMLEFKYARLDEEARADAPRLHPFSKFLCSYFAACIAQTTTYPMDTIRRRIQTDGFVPGTKGKLRYTGVMTTARIIIAQEGWRGFFKGVSVNWMRSPLATGISLTTYDILKEAMGVEKIV
ncbi:hypothetical protein Gpo141_00004911 [Globisporangium polare]